MRLPLDHPQRAALAREAHARPADALSTEARLSYLVMLTGAHPDGHAGWQSLGELLTAHGIVPPATPSNHFRADLGEFSVRFEQHTEFYRYTFLAPRVDSRDPFAAPAIGHVPAAWLERLPGELLVAVQAAIVMPQARHAHATHPDPTAPAGALDPELLARQCFDDNAIVGSDIGEGAGAAFTDFRLREDGFVRLLIENRHLTPRQAGRMVQRLLELETYRMLALLALPVARELNPFLGRAEEELAGITSMLTHAHAADEPGLLDRLTRLEAEIGNRQAQTDFRFRAAAAYEEIVQRRLRELRELRIHGLQTFSEFIERRLAPAMQTWRAAAERQESLSGRVARVTQLLATRVDITRELQNQQLLETMNRRADAQLRLQQTVEGLSVAAITYYLVGLIGYGAKGLAHLGVRIDPEITMACAVVPVAIAVAFSLHVLRHAILRRVSRRSPAAGSPKHPPSRDDAGRATPR